METKFDMETFRRPGAAYRSIPFWSWNCKVTEELIDSQLDCFARMGFGGVDIHPRVGLDNEYLGEEFMELVRYTVERCREKGLLCWLYDDDRFPSGAADGIVTKDMRYRDRGLLLTMKPIGEYDRGRAQFEQEISEGKKPGGYFLCAYILAFKDGLLESYERVSGMAEAAEAATQGKCVRYAYVELAKESSSFEGQTYVDVLNPKAIAEFIRVTHDRYHEVVGEEFGKCVQAIFTDEPRIGKQYQIRDAETDENFKIPYSEPFEEFFEKRCGIHMLEIVPELVWDMPEERHCRKRWLFRDALTECFALNFMDQICDWCGNHGIWMTGHVLSETPLLHQAATVGECMRSYRKMDIPGIDVLCNDPAYVTAKQAVSVSKQMGRQGTMSELYGVTDWDCSFRTYKLQGDWQAALGITKRVPHLAFMSMAGEGKRDWPASISCQSPWYEEYPYLEDHFARVNFCLSQGKPVTRVALIHPIESIWLHMGQADRNLAAVEKLQKDLGKITEGLLFAGIDVDYLSESLLPQLCGGTGVAGNTRKPDRVTLSVGEMNYTTVVVPPLETLRSSTLEILERFRTEDGRVIFLEKAPGLVDAERSERAKSFARTCETAEIRELVSLLEGERDIRIQDGDGRDSDNLFYQLREDAAGRWLFVCHVREKDNGQEDWNIRIRGHYGVTRYDTVAGEAMEQPASIQGEDTCVRWLAYGEDSILLRLKETHGAAEGQTESAEEPTFTVIKSLEKPDSVTLQEKNMLLLDVVRYSLDGRAVSEKMDILKADDEIRRHLGYERRGGHMLQPWATEEGELHRLSLYYEIDSEIETEASLAMELLPECHVTLNGQSCDMNIRGHYVDEAISVIGLPGLCRGRNELTVECLFHRKANPEAMYLLGDFGVELKGSQAVVKERNAALGFGDITAQGLPFYTGNLVYELQVEIEEEAEYAIRIPRWNAPAMAVWADGEKKGVVALSPYRLSLGKLCVGTHRLAVCLYGNRFNGFGILHNAEKNLAWIGPAAYRTEGDKWTEEYRVRPVGIMSEILVEMRKGFPGNRKNGGEE